MSRAIQGFCLCPNVEATKSLKRTWINLIISFSLLLTRLGRVLTIVIGHRAARGLTLLQTDSDRQCIGAPTVVSVDLPNNSRHASDGVPLDFLFELPQPSALLLKLPAASLAAV